MKSMFSRFVAGFVLAIACYSAPVRAQDCVGDCLETYGMPQRYIDAQSAISNYEPVCPEPYQMNILCWDTKQAELLAILEAHYYVFLEELELCCERKCQDPPDFTWSTCMLEVQSKFMDGLEDIIIEMFEEAGLCCEIEI